MYFSRFARTVTMLVRGESLSSRMSQYLIDQIGATDNVRVWTNSEVQEAVGSERLEKLVLARDGGRATETVQASALFVFTGAMPHTDWLGDSVARDPHGFILAGPDTSRNHAGVPHGPQDRTPFMLETSLPGVFVAGDVRHGSVKRVASAVGEGSMAVMYVHHYLNSV